MDCSLEARHIVINEEGNTHCGFAFTLLSPPAQRYLDRLITEFQWEERQIKLQQPTEEL
jgi:c-di-GMP-binding flagellar brake protein YcgR